MEALFAVSAGMAVLGWLGIPGPFVNNQPWNTVTPAAVVQPAPVIVEPIYTHDPQFRGCTYRNPCYQR